MRLRVVIRVVIRVVESDRHEFSWIGNKFTSAVAIRICSWNVYRMVAFTSLSGIINLICISIVRIDRSRMIRCRSAEE